MGSLHNKESCRNHFKADFFPMTVLQIDSTNIQDIQQVVSEAQSTAPQYFINAPIVIDVTPIKNKSAVDIKGLYETLKACQMIPVGIRGLPKTRVEQAREIGLAIISSVSKPEEPKKTDNKPAKPVTKVITKPVRAGTQVYAQDGDLIILAAVNSGAECIADGNIHVYGPLRGRALAGASGNPSARIFCEKLDAELISIAGRYLVKENLKIPRTTKPMLHIYLQNDQLKIEGI